MRTHSSISASLPLLLIVVMAAAGCSKQQAAAPPQRAVPVAVATARLQDVPVQVRAIGNVEAFSTVSIKAQVSGPVIGVHFTEGQDVKKGDLLFTIDPRPFQVALEQAQAALAKDTALLDNAKAQESRYAKLLSEGVIAQEVYDQFRTNYQAYQAAVAADQALIENAKLNLAYCTIRSPIDGRTGSLALHVGNLVKANDVPILVVITQVNPIYVSFAVPQQYLAEIRARMTSAPLRAEAFLEGDPVVEEGVLTFIDNTVDASTGTIRLKARFENHARRLWPGLFVNAVLTLGMERGAVVVPSEAVQEGQRGSYVFVIKADMTAEVRPVTVGRALAHDTVISKGLAAGEQVVTDGQIRLVTGTKVELR
jgi:multidrug efflux system membrane fusion protein